MSGPEARSYIYLSVAFLLYGLRKIYNELVSVHFSKSILKIIISVKKKKINEEHLLMKNIWK